MSPKRHIHQTMQKVEGNVTFHTAGSTAFLKSKVLDTDEKFSFTFTKPGTYPYFCSLQPKMTAKVIVE